MARLSKTEDPQAAILLLRYCGHYSMASYSTRSTLHGDPMRQTLGDIIHELADDRAWAQAQR